ncbi:MAG: hypothetical protein IT366_21745 [Candidatus Hydrogenedentes bacterium]|nr:hypothetical protein [Candidatus Hydrogenedentota bacterium]
MYWNLTQTHETIDPSAYSVSNGRFVLHRHHDANGPHLDLRFEQDGYLAGFRIDGFTLEGEVCATEKSAHPIQWLERDGDAIREDSGTYRRHAIGDNEMHIELHGAHGVRTLRATREAGLAPSTIRDVCATLRAHAATTNDAAKLIADGIAARRRATERLCGLARELDGAAFDEAICKRSLASLALEDIHAQLRSYESRFDAKYPPASVSQPSNLDEQANLQRNEDALAILRNDPHQTRIFRQSAS